MIDSHYKNAHARRIFNGIAQGYEGPARILSYFQYDRWRRYLVSQLNLAPQASVLDVCTGTGLVAIDIARRKVCRVVGVDLSDRMIERAQRDVRAHCLAPMVDLAEGRAESLPFSDQSFDVVVTTFLLRYVQDPQATLCELSRVLRPGGQLVSLEFFVPRSPGDGEKYYDMGPEYCVRTPYWEWSGSNRLAQEMTRKNSDIIMTDVGLIIDIRIQGSAWYELRPRPRPWPSAEARERMIETGGRGIVFGPGVQNCYEPLISIVIAMCKCLVNCGEITQKRVKMLMLPLRIIEGGASPCRFIAIEE